MKPVFLILCILSVLSALAQKSEVLSYDKDWQPTDPKKYVFIIEQKKVNDTCWEWNYYKFAAPRFLSKQFRQKQGGDVNGNYIVYGKNGTVDTAGYYQNGKKHGVWTIIATNRRLLSQMKYEDDVLVWTKDSTQVNEERQRRDDSIRKARTDTVVIHSQFPGGLAAWKNYLGSNLRYPKEALDTDVQGTVLVRFIVTESGKLTNIELAHSVEFHLDREALRLIRVSPDWTPAIVEGKKVKTSITQPIVFRFAE